MSQSLSEQSLIVEMKHVYYKVGKRPLLEDINWKICQGERWMLLGENGSGKTTLLSLIAGFGTFSSGVFKVFGKTYTQDNIFFLRKEIGFVSASFFNKYYRNESVSDILLSALSGSLGVRFDISLKDVKAAREALARFNIVEKFNSLYRALSKGEQQKVLLARALFQNPKLLLLDEPLSGLDQMSEKHAQLILQDVAKDEGVTIIYVSHHPEEIGEQIQKRLCLHQGRLIERER